MGHVGCCGDIADSRQQKSNSRQQIADGRQQSADIRQQGTSSDRSMISFGCVFFFLKEKVRNQITT
jgi:hypothetical protein